MMDGERTQRGPKHFRVMIAAPQCNHSGFVYVEPCHVAATSRLWLHADEVLLEGRQLGPAMRSEGVRGTLNNQLS